MYRLYWCLPPEQGQYLLSTHSTEEQAEEAAEAFGASLLWVRSHGGDSQGGGNGMMTQQVRVWIKNHAPSVIAVCSAVSIWVAPSIWLHGELKGLGAKVQANTVSS